VAIGRTRDRGSIGRQTPLPTPNPNSTPKRFFFFFNPRLGGIFTCLLLPSAVPTRFYGRARLPFTPFPRPRAFKNRFGRLRFCGMLRIARHQAPWTRPLSGGRRDDIPTRRSLIGRGRTSMPWETVHRVLIATPLSRPVVDLQTQATIEAFSKDTTPNSVVNANTVRVSENISPVSVGVHSPSTDGVFRSVLRERIANFVTQRLSLLSPKDRGQNPLAKPREAK